MINKLPVIGWLLSICASISLSIPFWICWTACGIGAKYFYWLPPVYQVIPFWSCVGLFIVISIIKGSLIPRLAHPNARERVEQQRKQERQVMPNDTAHSQKGRERGPDNTQN